MKNINLISDDLLENVSGGDPTDAEIIGECIKWGAISEAAAEAIREALNHLRSSRGVDVQEFLGSTLGRALTGAIMGAGGGLGYGIGLIVTRDIVNNIAGHLRPAVHIEIE